MTFFITCTLYAQVGDFSKEEVTKKIKIQRLVMSYISLKEFSGVVTVTIDGKKDPLYQYTTGFANLDYHVPNSLTALYNLCELSQALTATAIMQLVEKEKLDLQVPISTYLPEIAAKLGQPITIHQLLTHTAGLHNYYESESYMNNFLDIKKIDDLLQLIIQHPLDFTPGSQVKSSPANYILLATIIEKITGLSFANYIQTNVFKRANMSNAELYSWRDIIDNRGVGYTFDEEGNPILPATFWGAYPFGADGIYADSHSLMAFSEAFHNNKLVSEKTKKQMIQNYVFFDGDDPSDGFSYGWRTKKFFDKKVIYNGGELQGLSVQLRRYVEDGYTVLVLSNYHINKAKELAIGIENALCNPDYIAPGHPVGLLVQKSIEKHGITHTLEHVESLLAKSPIPLDKVWALNSLGKKYLKVKKLETAVALFEINAKKFPTDPEVFGNLGYTYLELKNYDKAISNLEQSLSLSPNDKWAIGLLERAKANKGKVNTTAIAQADNKPKEETTTPTNDHKQHKSDLTKTNASGGELPKNSSPLTTKKIPTETVTTSKAPPLTTPKENPLLSTNKKEEEHKKATTLSSESSNTSVDESMSPEITFDEPEFISETPLFPIPPTTPPKTEIPPPMTIPDLLIDEMLLEKTEAEAEQAKQLHKTITSNVYVVVDEMPQFPGGEAALLQYWKDNLRYPESAKKNGVEGIVHVSFIVETDGALKNIRIHKGMIGGGNGCENEALRLVRSMPHWKFGQQHDLPARVFYTLAVPFTMLER